MQRALILLAVGAAAASALASSVGLPGETTIGVEWEQKAHGVDLSSVTTVRGGGTPTYSDGSEIEPSVLCSAQLDPVFSKYPLVSLTYDMSWKEFHNSEVRTLEIVTGPIAHSDRASWDAVLAFLDRFYGAFEAACRNTEFNMDPLGMDGSVRKVSPKLGCSASVADVLAHMHEGVCNCPTATNYRVALDAGHACTEAFTGLGLSDHCKVVCSTRTAWQEAKGPSTGRVCGLPLPGAATPECYGVGSAKNLRKSELTKLRFTVLETRREKLAPLRAAIVEGFKANTQVNLGIDLASFAAVDLSLLYGNRGAPGWEAYHRFRTTLAANLGAALTLEQKGFAGLYYVGFGVYMRYFYEKFSHLVKADAHLAPMVAGYKISDSVDAVPLKNSFSLLPKTPLGALYKRLEAADPHFAGNLFAAPRNVASHFCNGLDSADAECPAVYDVFKGIVTGGGDPFALDVIAHPLDPVNTPRGMRVVFEMRAEVSERPKRAVPNWSSMSQKTLISKMRIDAKVDDVTKKLALSWRWNGGVPIPAGLP